MQGLTPGGAVPSAGQQDFNKDTDKDGLPDQLETIYGTNPNKADTDGDGFKDGEEIEKGYNPNGPGKLF
ncbi:MAG: calcium-binding protein [Parcubacteria group bacterium CG_4_10_14_0_8_um_filter_35_7]|nr:MAG: calcium-binding protein [Parcubacteria group bacterium CG_4_10_14_0_8_um_filter_35_7]